MNPAATFRSACFNHATREAALQCMGCGRRYCRECASEHDGRFLCAGCLREAAEDAAKPSAVRGLPLQFALLAATLLVLWGGFYALGAVVMNVTAPTHDEMVSMPQRNGE